MRKITPEDRVTEWQARLDLIECEWVSVHHHCGSGWYEVRRHHPPLGWRTLRRAQVEELVRSYEAAYERKRPEPQRSFYDWLKDQKP
jgi:hypothetical protein